MFVKENPDRKKKHIVNCSPENVLLSVGCKEVQRGGGTHCPIYRLCKLCFYAFAILDFLYLTMLRSGFLCDRQMNVF